MRRNNGFAYIALLMFLAILMLVITAASESISTNVKREKEQQLFFVGEQFYNAIVSYYESSPKEIKQFPKKLDDLLEDNRSVKPVRHLRKLYHDPMTNSTSWGLVKNEKQQIIGIFSLSSDTVLKTNFDRNLVAVDGKEGVLMYSDLKFIYTRGQ